MGCQSFYIQLERKVLAISFLCVGIVYNCDVFFTILEQLLKLYSYCYFYHPWYELSLGDTI